MKHMITMYYKGMANHNEVYEMHTKICIAIVVKKLLTSLTMMTMILIKVMLIIIVNFTVRTIQVRMKNRKKMMMKKIICDIIIYTPKVKLPTDNMQTTFKININKYKHLDN